LFIAFLVSNEITDYKSLT